MLNLQSKCKPHPDVIFQLADEEVVLVLPRAGQIKVLNEVGTFIWSMLDGNLSIADIAEQICQEYRVDYEHAQADAVEFLNELQTKGIIQVITP
jgi:hypothetical protein